MKVSRIVGVVVCLSLVVLNVFAAEAPKAKAAKAKPAPAPSAEMPSDLPPPAITLGAQGGEGIAEGFGDILAPFYLGKSGLWFVNPRFSANDNEEEELNVGLGYRHLFGDKSLIVGGNVYYDSRWTANDNQFDQVGFGVELLSEWIDARANVYLPEDDEQRIGEQTEVDVQSRTSSSMRWYDPYAEGNEIKQEGRRITRTTTTTTTYLFEQFEQAREGWDAEIGFKVPGLDKLAEVRVFGGYYSWDSEYAGCDKIEGAKGRVEVRVMPALYLDAAVFEDKELNGSDWLVGARLNLPFDTKNLSQKKNPFEGAFAKEDKPVFANRLTEMVIRDLAVRTEQSGWIENVAARQVESRTRTRKKTLRATLMDDVTFVDGDNLGLEDGTAENPYNTIQEGVDNALSPVVVMPQAGGAEYVENVLLATGVDLYGAHAIVGNGGKRLGGRPTIDGRAADLPAIRMANDTLVAGFRVWNTAGNPTPDPILGVNRYDRTGIYGGNVTDVRLSDNIVEFCSQGGLFVANAVPDFDIRVDDCVFQNNIRDGFQVRAIGTGIPNDDFWATIRNSTFADNAGDGCLVRAQNYTMSTIEMSDLTALRNGNDGVRAVVTGGQAADASVSLDNVYAEANGQAALGNNGITVQVTPNAANSWARVDIWDCAAVDTVVGSGLSVTLTAGDAYLYAINNDFVDNDAFGMNATVTAANSAEVDISHNVADNNGWGVSGDGDAGIQLTAAANGPMGPFAPTLGVRFENNLIEDQEQHGAILNLNAPVGEIRVGLLENVIRWNDGVGLTVNAAAPLGFADFAMIDDTIINNGSWYGDHGADVTINALALFAEVAGLNASDNDQSGLNLVANAAGGMNHMSLYDVVANDNGLNGVFISQVNTGGDAWMIAGTDLNGAEAFYTAAMGGAFAGFGDALLFAGGLPVAPVQANGNGNSGLVVVENSAAGPEAVILLANTVARGNGFMGIDCTATAPAGDANIGIVNSGAKRNAINGIAALVNGATAGGIGMAGSSAENNGANGAVFDITSPAGAEVFVQGSVFGENAFDGALVVGALPVTIDFGGGPLGSQGRNAFFNNGALGLNNTLGTPASAENNFWGGLEPALGVDYNVNVTPPATWLEGTP